MEPFGSLVKLMEDFSGQYHEKHKIIYTHTHWFQKKPITLENGYQKY